MQNINHLNSLEEMKMTIDFNADAENIIRDIMKHHKIQDKYEQLDLVEKINDSLEGNQVSTFSQTL